MEDDAVLNLVDTSDRITFLVSLRITSTDEHHAHGSARIDLYRVLVEVAIGYALKEIYDVALQSQHHCLGLRVTHTAVVLDHHRLTFDVDQSEENKALVVDTLLSEAVYGRTDDAILDFLHPLLVGKGHRRYTTHAAGVQSRVVLTDTLVVFGLGKYLIVFAICQDEDRALDAAEELLNDDLSGSVAEHSAEHLTELLLGLVERRHNQHAFTGCQSVGFQHVGRLESLQEADAFLYGGAVEGLISSGRDVVALHETFGEVLAALKNSTLLARSDHGDGSSAAVALESIIDTAHQRILRTDHNHVDGFVHGKVFQGIEIVDSDRYILSYVACSGVSRSDEEL